MKVNETNMILLEDSLHNLINSGIDKSKDLVKTPEIKGILDEIFKNYKPNEKIKYADLEKYFVDDEVFDVVMVYLTDYRNCQIDEINDDDQKVIDELEYVDYATETKSSDAIGQFLKELGQSNYDNMTFEQEQEIFKAYIKSKEENDGVGDPVLRQEILERNIKLVVSIAKIYAFKMSLGDLINVGVTGLSTAVDKYDITKGYKFSTYATWWIRQSITRYIANENRIIKLPVHLGEQINKIALYQKKYEAEHGVQPTIEELSELTGINTEKIRRAMYLSLPTQSLQSTILSDESRGTEIQDFVADPRASIEQIMEDKDLKKQLVNLLADLDLKGCRVLIERYGFNLLDEDLIDDPNAQNLLKEITSYYGLKPQELCTGKPKTLEVVGNEFHVTRERVRQIEAKTLRKLRNPVRKKYIKDYFE